MLDFQKEADKINPRTLGVLMLGYAYGKGLIPLRKESILEGIKLTLREKLWEMNFRAFERELSCRKNERLNVLHNLYIFSLLLVVAI